MNVFEVRACLTQEQRLYHTSQERQNYESMATLFSLISCLDYLERAYVRGAVREEEYTPACARLLGQYKTVMKLISDPSTPEHFRFGDVGAFMAYYDVRAALTQPRLSTAWSTGIRGSRS